MGQSQHSQTVNKSARPLRPRSCLRKGCGRMYQPSRWNQRYCQQADCTRRLRRWQAAKRQRAHRQIPANRKRHAEAEAIRRRERRTARKVQDDHAADKTDSSQDRAWSRSRKFPDEFCDRPGCYEPLPDDSRAPVRYCGGDCRQAVRRVLDRERKWLARNQYVATGTRRTPTRRATDTSAGKQLVMTTETPRDNAKDAKQVGDYRGHSSSPLSCRANEHDSPPSSRQDTRSDAHSKTNPDHRPRPPPAG